MEIGWDALLGRARNPRDRAAIEDLRWLDSVRASAAGERLPHPRASSFPSLLLRGLIAIAAVQVVLGLSAAAAPGFHVWPPAPALPRLLLAMAFGASSVLLGAAAPRDSRCLFLCATFAFTASAFARGIPAAAGIVWPAPLGAFFRGVLPEAFAPAALCQFATVFPSVRRFTSSDTFARRATIGAWVVGSILFMFNAGLALELVDAGRLARGDPANLFWHLFAAAALPGLIAMCVRARRATVPEQRKAARFATALAVGFAPFLLVAVARMALPPFETWLTGARSPGRLWVDVPILATLASVPIRTTLAVLVDRTFETGIAPVEEVFAWPAAAGRLAGLRGWLLRATRRDRASAAFDRIARARGARELAAVLQRELQFGLDAPGIRVLEPRSLPTGTALLHMLQETAGLLDLSQEGPLFALLPRRDREWLEVQGVAVAAPIKRRDDALIAVVALGPRSGQLGFDKADRWLVSALIAAAAVAWEALEAASTSSGIGEEPALECQACGMVGEREPLSCACGGGAMPAALPAMLAGKFDILRRLGSGGMGVVYLARDTALDRIVAVKTLPELRDGTVSRLAAEARAMAALNHDALATIYGVEFWRRTPVLVMEYFPSGTLAERLDQERALSPLEVVAVGLRLAGALAYMHGRGVLHRDIKPRNVGLSETGAVKLLDFGLAAELQPSAGTREYLPPEAFRGEPPVPAFDLWALSKVLLECCGPGASIPGSLRAFLGRALSADPAARFQDAEEYRAALEKVAGVMRVESPVAS